MRDLGLNFDEYEKFVTLKKLSERPYILVFLKHLERFIMFHIKVSEHTGHRSGVSGILFKQRTLELCRLEIIDGGRRDDRVCVRFDKGKINSLDRGSCDGCQDFR